MNDIRNSSESGEPVWIEKAKEQHSSCVEQPKRFYCDLCKHPFMGKDIAVRDDVETVCKCCYGVTPYLMDNLSVRYFKSSKKPCVMLCVEEIDNKLQMKIRSYGMGMSVIFPAMNKVELVKKWLDDSTEWNNNDIRLIFDSAVLLIIPDYITREELKIIRTDWIQQQVKN